MVKREYYTAWKYLKTASTILQARTVSAISKYYTDNKYLCRGQIFAVKKLSAICKDNCKQVLNTKYSNLHISSNKPQAGTAIYIQPSPFKAASSCSAKCNLQVIDCNKYISKQQITDKEVVYTIPPANTVYIWQLGVRHFYKVQENWTQWTVHLYHPTWSSVLRGCVRE